nr:rRNA adenine methyltransferase [Pedobacter panaciterrae]
MHYDPNNNVVKLCAEGMNLEGAGKKKEALKLFLQAWEEATNDLEKFTSAHYVARHQKSVLDKLKWDKMALDFALKIDDESVKGAYPSLYLNIAKAYEDLREFDNAKKHYQIASSFTQYLLQDGYGAMIKGGIANGLERLNGHVNL